MCNLILHVMKFFLAELRNSHFLDQANRIGTLALPARSGRILVDSGSIGNILNGKPMSPCLFVFFAKPVTGKKNHILWSASEIVVRVTTAVLGGEGSFLRFCPRFVLARKIESPLDGIHLHWLDFVEHIAFDMLCSLFGNVDDEHAKSEGSDEHDKKKQVSDPGNGWATGRGRIFCGHNSFGNGFGKVEVNGTVDTGTPSESALLLLPHCTKKGDNINRCGEKQFKKIALDFFSGNR